MGREPEELQFMGFFGIYKESFKLIISWKKIFSQIYLALILPLSIISLAQIQLPTLTTFHFSFEFHHNQPQLNGTSTGTPSYNQISSSLNITSECITFWLFKAVLLIFSLILSLLSTSAVVYTIACIYTSKLEMLTFTKVMSIVPKVWKRLMVTFLWNSVVLFVYNILAMLLMAVVVMVFVLLVPQQIVYIVILVVLLICFFVGLVCISVVCQLANVVSVLEDIYGIKAMAKSKEFIKGKMWVASFTFLAIQICLSVIQVMFETLVVHNNGTEGGGLGIGSRVGYGLLCVVLYSVLMHISLVTQTVIYFVCKSYHQKNIHKSFLADHLEAVYIGEYAPLKSKDDVQFESFDV